MAGWHSNEWPAMASLLDAVQGTVDSDGKHGELFISYGHTPSGWRWEVEVYVADKDRNICLARPSLVDAVQAAVEYVTRDGGGSDMTRDDVRRQETDR